MAEVGVRVDEADGWSECVGGTAFGLTAGRPEKESGFVLDKRHVW